MTHFIHLHEEQWHTISVDGKKPPPWERGLEDTWRLDPGETIKVAAQVHRLHRRLHAALPHARPRGRRDDGAVRGGQPAHPQAAAGYYLSGHGPTGKATATDSSMSMPMSSMSSMSSMSAGTVGASSTTAGWQRVMIRSIRVLALELSVITVLFGLASLPPRRALGDVACRDWLDRRRRALQLGLGVIWLLDAALQYQPYMFSEGFPHQILAPVGPGNPGWVAQPVRWAAHLTANHVVAMNALFATAQLLIALGLFTRATVRLALAGSVLWALGVWWMGEGLGGLLVGPQSPIMGSPGQRCSTPWSRS